MMTLKFPFKQKFLCQTLKSVFMEVHHPTKIHSTKPVLSFTLLRINDIVAFDTNSGPFHLRAAVPNGQNFTI